MQRVLGRSNFLLLLAMIVFLLISCGEKKEAEFEKYDPIFVDRFSNEDDIDSIHISSLEAYYYEDQYYYTVTYTQDGEEFVFELLYIFRHGVLDMFFSIKDEAECYTYVPTRYEAYLKAKEKGIAKVYSNKEIADMINEFYGRTIINDTD